MIGFEWLTWPVVGGPLMLALGIVSAVHASKRVRTPQGTIAWCIALLACPVVAVPLYWVFGRTKFYEYRDELRKVWSRHAGPVDAFRQNMRRYRSADIGSNADLQVLDRLTAHAFTGGNKARLLIDGDQTFDALFEAISQAKRYILFQFYIIRDDSIGRRFQEKLIERARAGVRVYVLYDALGSYRTGRRFFERFKEAGIEVGSFAAMRRWRQPFQLNFRNHRKIVVVDGRVAFVGGLNVGDEYCGRQRRLSPWRDTHLEVRGPAVQSAQMIFQDDWQWARRSILPDLEWTPLDVSPDGYDVIMLPSGPTNPREACTILFVSAIHAARRRLWIATPYFVPDSSIVNALAMAVLRGVDVRILLPSVGDSWIVHLASFDFLRPMEDIGVQVFRYEEGFLHEKAFVVDDEIAYIGTANLDNRSFRLNFELHVVVVDERFAAKVSEMLERDFGRSRRTGPDDLARRSFAFRLGTRIARLFEPVL